MKFSVAARSKDLCPVNGNKLVPYYMGPKHISELWVYIGTPRPNPSGNTGVMVCASLSIWHRSHLAWAVIDRLRYAVDKQKHVIVLAYARDHGNRKFFEIKSPCASPDYNFSLCQISFRSVQPFKRERATNIHLSSQTFAFIKFVELFIYFTVQFDLLPHSITFVQVTIR